MKPLARIASLTLIGTLLGLSGCVWRDDGGYGGYGGGYGRGGGDHGQRRGGEDHGDRGRGCGDEHRDGCEDQHHD